jgi:rhodanese-related sulfurtransferase
MTRRFAALAASALLRLFGQNPAKDPPKVRQLSAEEITEAIEKKKVFFLDVREPKELTELGTMKGYVNIPLSQLESRLKELPRNRPILTA